MQCREVRDLADSFLSEQLLVETNHEVLRHLDNCPDCRAELEARRALRTAIQRAFLNADALRMREDFARDTGPSLRTVSLGAGLLSRRRAAAAAAVAALAAGAGLFLLPDDVDAIALDAVGDHRNCAVRFRLAEKPIPLEEAERRHAAWYGRLLDTPPAELAISAGPVRVVERHACVFNGRRFAHVVMQTQGQLVSLLVTEDRRWLPSLTGGEGPPHLASQPEADGVSVVSFRTSRHRVFFVSNLSDPELRAVAGTLAEPVAGRLSGARDVAAQAR
jgi:anti-sigma factor RsiW